MTEPTISVQFRRFHAKEILSRFDITRGPLDLFISLSFRHMPQLGAKDRAYISELIYSYYRLKSILDYLYKDHEKKSGASCQEYWTFIFNIIENPDLIQQFLLNNEIPHHIRVNLPLELYNLLKKEWNEEFDALALSLNKSAPLTIRVNTLKISVDELIKRLQAHELVVEKDPQIKEALHFARRASLFNLPEFSEGLFEIQDSGSQMVSYMVEALPKQHILDYCSGSGGKTLAIAPKLQGSGQIYLHDVRDEALISAKKRLSRAGIQNVQWITSSEKAKLSRLQGKMDWVLVDAPCSGTGTLRRNPDMKWKFSPEMVTRLQAEQKEILKRAVAFMKPTGRLVYATCSLLRAENEDIAEFAEKELNLEIDVSSSFHMAPFIKTAPHTGLWDGFFAVRFKKKT